MIERTPTGIRLIIGYKLVKSVVQVAAAVALVAWASPRRIAEARHLMDVVDAHLAARWSVHLARALTLATRPHTLHLLAAAAGIDGGVSFLEGYCLWRGYRWAPWLVVVATATPLPLEVHALARRLALGRVVVIAVNVAVIAYLAARIARRRRDAGARPRGARGSVGGRET